MKGYIKLFVNKYIPLVLHKYLYIIYKYGRRIYNTIRMYCNMYLLQKHYCNNLIILNNITKFNTVQILQPTFYDLDGKDYFLGGAERYLNDLSQIIIDIGYKPYIVQCGNCFWHKKHNDKIDVFGVPVGSDITLLNEFAGLTTYFDKPKLRIYSPFAIANTRDTSTYSIGISHGIFWDHPHYVNQSSMLIESFLNLDMFVSVDTSTISWFRAMIPDKLQQSERMLYIPNYVDVQKFAYASSSANNIDNDKIVIIYPRRLCRYRGLFNVAAIAGNIIEKYPKVELHFVGSMDLEVHDTMHELVNKFGNKRIMMYKESDDMMYKIYQKADIVLIPTINSEGTSLSCLEAMATGNAIIATNVGGLSDLIIDGYNGLLIDPNPTALQKAIEILIENPKLRLKLGNNAANVAICFDKKIWQSKWIELLNKCLR